MKLKIQRIHGGEPLAIIEEGNQVQIVSEQVNTYEIIDQSNKLCQEAVTVLNYIGVYSEKRERFEERFLQRPRMIENEQGFIAIRVLRPLQDDIYIVLTQWQTEEDFRNWQASTAYQHAHKNRNTQKGIDQEQGVLKGKPYHYLYQASHR
ncbi:hypothetical protein CAI16_14630 [Virgibacillus dokdonensis]|uniref:ABM domain-containing protein n=2 Tax=Virgibacillus TaxID=84406 RepID=A0A3E0WMX5_9BACI|nr:MULTISPECIES: antibiotic biosynthesis monooxygenase [Virgibacillus]RFA33501.1 hypothetical protein CAI16_14630 [Virgibacillus dokdonensis]